MGYQNFRDSVFQWICAFLLASRLHREHVMKLDFLVCLYTGWTCLPCYIDCLHSALKHYQRMGCRFCDLRHFQSLAFAWVPRIRGLHHPGCTGFFIHECCFCHYSLKRGCSTVDWTCSAISMKIVRVSVAEMTPQAGIAAYWLMMPSCTGSTCGWYCWDDNWTRRIALFRTMNSQGRFHVQE